MRHKVCVCPGMNAKYGVCTFVKLFIVLEGVCQALGTACVGHVDDLSVQIAVNVFVDSVIFLSGRRNAVGV